MIFELGPAQPQPTDRQVLCLSGGGYRGLFTALVLEKLEDKAGKPLEEHFDAIAGTSVGGVLAAGLALRVPASKMRTALERHGPQVFDSRLRVGRWRLPVGNRFRVAYRARYRQAPLAEVIEELLAPQKLSEVEKPLLLPAVELGANAPQLLVSGGFDRAGVSDLKLRDALLATTAAPTYFPPHRVNDRVFVDGGLVANAPDLAAVTEAVRLFGCKLDELRVLSIGTVGIANATAPRFTRAPGLIEWVVRTGLVQLTLAAQERLAVQQCEVLLGQDRYRRIDYEPESECQRHLSLDGAGRESTCILRACADAALKPLFDPIDPAIRQFLSHAASERPHLLR